MTAAEPSDDELAAWLHLLHSAGIGRESARRLLAAFGSPQGVIDAGSARRAGLVGADAATAIDTPPDGHQRRLADTLAWRRAATGRRVMVLGDADFPPLLLHTADPPLLLYLQGRIELLHAASVAIVGSRQPSAQGLDNARGFAHALSARGWTVVSGLAAGIDGAAHDGALAGALAAPPGGSTVAVIGTGIDRVYPASHKALAHRIAQHGLIVSELALGTPPLAANFPQRNRLIAGLTRGTLVVEAAVRSGSLITARLAAEAGREVMAMPGSVLSKQSQGCHALIRQGAALVASADDVLEELNALPPLIIDPPALATTSPGHPGHSSGPANRFSPPGGPPETPETPDPVLSALGHDPLSIDTLTERCGWPVHLLSAHLLALELDGLVARLPGGLYQRRQTV